MNYLIWVISAALLVLLSACGQEQPSQAVSEAPKRSAAVPAPQGESTQEVVEAEAEVYVYNPAGRRDPFEPLLLVRRPVVQSDAPLTPLQAFELGQLRLTGVIIGKGNPRAMVVAPDGKAYILKRGIHVGKNNGVVKDIRRDGVLVEESYYDFTGEVRRNMLEITLPKREGV
jgi:type IV pilus assembly protein PilP